MRLAFLTFLIAFSYILWPSLGLPARRLQEVDADPEDLATFSRAGCDNFTNHLWQALRPGYHITVPYGWLNDPHGLFQLNGATHMFFQYNPKALQWGAPFWGHVVSHDLAHLTWLPPALLPDQPYDRHGVWSGSATINNYGTPVLTYTAAGSHVPEMGNFFQQQALAVAANISDPWLKEWRKSPRNPFLSQVPPGGTNFQFRDPTEAKDAVWAALTSPQNPNPLPTSHYALAVGSQAFCMGGAGIYTAVNLTGPWAYAGTLYNQLATEPQINGHCTASHITGGSSEVFSPAYGGPCDQFGAYCRMWEVVDFMELQPSVFMIKWDDQSRFREVFSMEWYVLGNGPWDYSALYPKHAGDTKYTGSTTSLLGRTSSTTGASTAAATDDATPLSELPRKFAGFGAEKETHYALHDVADSSSSSSSVGLGQQYDDNLPKAHGISPSDSDHDTDFNYVEAAADAATKSLFRGELDGRKFAPVRTDYGSLYASTVFRTEDGRQVMLSWIYDTAAGCADMCSDQLPEVLVRMGFKGVHTLPRQLSYNPSTKTLRAYPVEEITQLRGAQLYDVTAAVLDVTSLTMVLPVGTVNSAAASGSSSTARQFEAQLNFTLQQGGMNDAVYNSSSGSTSSGTAVKGVSGIGPALQPDEFAMGCRITLSKEGDKYVEVYLRGTVGQRPAYSTPSITALSVWVDRTHAGSSTNTTYMEGGDVPLPVTDSVSNTATDWFLPDQPLSLSVWVDHSVIEVFAMGGLARVTSRIYPGEDDVAWGLSTWVKPPSAVPLLQQLTGIDSYAGNDSVADAYLVVAKDADLSSTTASIGNRKRGVLTWLGCWWCKLWYSKCSCQCSKKDPRCTALWHVHSAGSSFGGGLDTALQQQSQDAAGIKSSNASKALLKWAVLLDGAVWEVRNAWLLPAC